MSKNTRKTSLHNFCHHSVAGGLQPFTNSGPLAGLPVFFFFKGLRHNLIISPNLSMGLKWRCKPSYLEETCIRGLRNTNCTCIGPNSAWDKTPQPSIRPPREKTKINGTPDFAIFWLPVADVQQICEQKNNILAPPKTDKHATLMTIIKSSTATMKWNFLPSKTRLKIYQKLKEDKKRKNNTDC